MAINKAAENASASNNKASTGQRREAFYLCLASIPIGKVVSYGQLAEMAGLGRGARLAARLLTQLPEDTRLPWHRVIRACGHPGLGADCLAGQEQRQRLRDEGVILCSDRVDMRRHRWHSVPARV